jgi:hypothetical protein
MGYIECTFLLLLILGMLGTPALGQPVLDDESDFYAETKQLNQFFRRFNAEESLRGDRYYPGDSAYRDIGLRKKYLIQLFDKENPLVTQDIKDAFIATLCDEDSVRWLDFHGGNWFSQVETLFKFRGQDIPVRLYMRLEQAAVGSKWVITKAFVPEFDSLFTRPVSSRPDSFLHPLSHELEFMNLGKVFKKQGSMLPFLAKNRNADHLTLLLYFMEQGEMRFRAVEEVHFHFFQIPGWYFEVAQFNRPSFNKGWLISKLTQIDEDKKDVLKAYIEEEQP